VADNQDRGAPSSRPSEDTDVRGELLYQAIARDFSDPKLASVKADTLARVLGDVPLFAHLNERELRRVAERAKVAHVTAGQVIVREGTSSEALYVLLTGAVRVSSKSGDERQLGRGAFFGELGPDRAPRTCTVTAERDLWLVRLSASDFRTLVAQEPAIARSLGSTPTDPLLRLPG
jgi:PPM family protein phosphatase